MEVVCNSAISACAASWRHALAVFADLRQRFPAEARGFMLGSWGCQKNGAATKPTAHVFASGLHTAHVLMQF